MRSLRIVEGGDGELEADDIKEEHYIRRFRAQHATKGETPINLERGYSKQTTVLPQEGEKHGENCPRTGRSTEAAFAHQ
jgi:hypothetical protein